MPSPPPHLPSRAVIIGGGAVGSHLAASLRSGLPLLVIDRDERVRTAFKARGIEAASPCDDAALLPGSDSGFFRRGDVVILATSSSAAATAAQGVPAWVPIVCVANGLTPDLAAARRGSLSYGVVEFAVSCHTPGGAARTQVGWLTLQRRSPGDAAARFAGALDPRRQRTRLTDDIDAHRHSKLMLNASLDPVAAIIGGTIGDVFRRPESFRAFRALLSEALIVARAAGWRLRAVHGIRPEVLSLIFATPLVRAASARIAAWHARDVASTLARQIERGEIGEAEHLCGEIVREGARRGVATPAHVRAMELLRRVAAKPGGRGGRPELASELAQC